MKTCSIIGNGLTRKEIELDQLPKPTFGCNAIFREFIPDYLFAIDPIPVWEIMSSSACSNFVPTPLFYQFEDPEYHNYNPSRPRNNAGMVAMQYAIEQGGFEQLNCYGFDFLLENNSEYLTKTVYDGSLGYQGTNNATLQDILCRIEYFKWFVRKHSSVKFNFYYPSQYTMINLNINNVRRI